MRAANHSQTAHPESSRRKGEGEIGIKGYGFDLGEEIDGRERSFFRGSEVGRFVTEMSPRGTEREDRIIWCLRRTWRFLDRCKCCMVLCFVAASASKGRESRVLL